MHKVWSLLLLVAVSSGLLGSPPEVPKAIKARPGQLVRVSVKSEVEIGSLRTFSDEDGFFEELASKAGIKRYVFQSDKPGVYVIGWWTKGETEGVSTVITVGDGDTPKPKPDPTPDPTPVGTFPYVYITVVEDKVNRTPSIVKNLKAVDSWRDAAYVKAAATYDKNDTDERVRTFVDAATADAKFAVDWSDPVVLVSDPDGKFLFRQYLSKFKIEDAKRYTK